MNNDLPSRIKSFNAGRNQEVLPIKYNLMAQDPFSFFRGTCHLFYEDLLANYPFAPSPRTWACGDLHIENFGCYKGSNRLSYFDMNDFDESLRVPLLYEIARLVVSVDVKCTQIKSSAKEKKAMISSLLLQYRNTLINTKALVIEQETATGLIRKLMDKVAKRKANGLLLTRTNNKTTNPKLLLSDKLLELEPKKKKELITAFGPWFNTTHFKGYRVTDAGIRIAGTGSIGIRRYICLLQNENNPKQKKLIDIKEALPSCLLNYTKLKQPVWQNEAERVVATQQLIQHVSPALLSAFNFDDGWYVVKQLQPSSDKICIQENARQDNHLEKYIADLAMVTASAQLRSSGRLKAATADELKAFAQGEAWIKPLTAWCHQYAGVVQQDYNDFCKARKGGFYKP